MNNPKGALQYPPSFYDFPSAEDLTAGSHPRIAGGLKEIVIYLKDGTVYAVRQFAVVDGKLRYTTTYGDENSIDLDRLDLQKTVDANAARGVKFSLTPPRATRRSECDTEPRACGSSPLNNWPITAQ